RPGTGLQHLLRHVRAVYRIRAGHRRDRRAISLPADPGEIPTRSLPMRSLLVCCILLALTASCSQDATSQSASSQSAAADVDTAFQPRMVVRRIREADCRYSLGIVLSEKQSRTVPLIRQKLDAALETRFATQTDSPASFVFGEGPFHFA